MAFSPLPAEAFDAAKAAHLLWRAGFGGTWSEAEALAARGLEPAVEWLLAPARESDSAASGQPAAPPECALLEPDHEEFHQKLRALPEQEKRELARKRRHDERKKVDELKRWWLEKMLTTDRPLEEKLTLFWHSHFASSFADKIQYAYPMWQQNECFRRFAFGRFPDQLRQLIRDPAMLVWLDNAQSKRQKPNENFARELMELFTIGIGNYTEADVKESARALTGFSIRRESWEFVFRAQAHDVGQKTFLGNTGDWSGDDIVEILCEQPAASRFMARKYLEFFLWPNPEPELVEAAAKLYREADLELAPFLRTLFLSREFYSPRAIGALIKSPVVLALGALKSMRLALPQGPIILNALSLMGQDLFFPPDVNGWPGGINWINSNVLLVRYNFSNLLINGVNPETFRVRVPREPGVRMTRRQIIEAQRSLQWSPREQLIQLGLDRKLNDPKAVVDFYLRDFLHRSVEPEFHRQLVAFLETDAAGGRKSFSFDDPTFDERVRGLVHLIMSSPDYQLC